MEEAPARPSPPDSITVVLHQPSVPDNIGAVARVMGNTGFSRLILSDPQVSDMTNAYKTAVSAAAILGEARTFPDLPAALAGAGAEFVVGVTARNRSYWNLRSIHEAAPLVIDESSRRPVALVFGPERAGLTNEELDRCHLLVTLPTGGPVTSYNLSHAVLLVLFSLMTCASAARFPPLAPVSLPSSAPSSAPLPEEQRRATREEVEGMYAHLEEMLTAAGFLWEDNPEHMMRLFRAFLDRAEPRKREVQAMRGVCRTMLWRLRGR